MERPFDRLLLAVLTAAGLPEAEALRLQTLGVCG